MTVALADILGQGLWMSPLCHLIETMADIFNLMTHLRKDSGNMKHHARLISLPLNMLTLDFYCELWTKELKIIVLSHRNPHIHHPIILRCRVIFRLFAENQILVYSVFCCLNN